MEPLAELARKGRKLQEERDQAALAETRGHAKKRQRQAERSSTSLGLLVTPPGFYCAGVLSLVAGLGGAELLGWFEDQRMAGLLALPVAVVAVTLGVGLVYLPVRWLCGQAFRRELAWVRGLPFEVSGYEAALAGIAQSRFGVAVELAADPASPEELISACRASGPFVEVTLQGRRLMISNTAIAGRNADYVGSERTPHTNNAFRGWFHGIADGLLVAINQSVGIRRVTVG